MNEEIKNELVKENPSQEEINLNVKVRMPDASSKEFVDYANERYDDTIAEAKQLNRDGRISDYELARTIMDAAYEYNNRMREHAEAVAREEAEEDALAEFDTDLKEQIRIERKLKQQIKERVQSERKRQKEEKQRQQLEKLRAERESYQQAFKDLQNNSNSPKTR